eukprot:549002_1
MKLRSFNDTIAFLSLSLAVILAKMLHSLVPLPVFVVVMLFSAWWIYKAIRDMYSEESPRESQAAKGKARKADNVAKSLIAELDKEDKAKGKAKKQNNKTKGKAKASSNTPSVDDRKVDDDDDDDDAFLDRAAARMASKKKK